MDIEFQKLANELDCTELELRVVYMVRSACGEHEQRSTQGEPPFELMRRVELKHARAIIKAVRLHTGRTFPVREEAS